MAGSEEGSSRYSLPPELRNTAWSFAEDTQPIRKYDTMEATLCKKAGKWKPTPQTDSEPLTQPRLLPKEVEVEECEIECENEEHNDECKTDDGKVDGPFAQYMYVGEMRTEEVVGRALGTPLDMPVTPVKHRLPQRDGFRASEFSSDLFRTSCGPKYRYGRSSCRVGEKLTAPRWYPETQDGLVPPDEVVDWSGWDQPVKNNAITHVPLKARKAALPPEARGQQARLRSKPRPAEAQSFTEQLLAGAPPCQQGSTEDRRPAEEWGTREIGTRLLVPSGEMPNARPYGRVMSHLKYSGKRMPLPKERSATYGVGMNESKYSGDRFEHPLQGEQMKRNPSGDSDRSASRYESGGLLKSNSASAKHQIVCETSDIA